MKLAKMSLVAALALSANVYAIDNVKVNGEAKVYYGTADVSYKNGARDLLGNPIQTADMFDKESSYADAALHLGLTADLTEGVSTGFSVTAVSTLGLENNLVSNTWTNAHSVSPSTGASFVGAAAGSTPGVYSGDIQLDDEMWVDEAWIAGTAFDTTVKIGRQELDTPLAFTEKWGIDTNTFEAAVLINQSIPDTTIVATYIGKSNGSADDEAPALVLGATVGGVTPVIGGTLNGIGRAQTGYVAQGGEFSTFGKDGVYAAGVINNSLKPLTAQAWYYDMQGLAKAYWLQADINMGGILVGAQYTNVDPDTEGLNAYLGGAGLVNVDDTSAYSAMIGYEMKDVVTVKAAYSSVSDDVNSVLGVANTATGGAATLGGQSKLYTEMWWNYGQVSAVGADSYSITAEATVGPEVALFLGYYHSEIDKDQVIDDFEVDEIAFTASKSFGPLDTTLALIYDEYDQAGGLNSGDVDDMTSLQVYITYNF